MCAEALVNAPIAAPAGRWRAVRRAAAHGLSMVELMVGVLVAMLVILVAVNTAMQFNATQRQGFAVGSGALNASNVLAAVKDDLATAGLGLFGEASMLCTQLNLSVGAKRLMDGADLAPLRIQRDPNGHDRIDALYADGIEGGAAVLLGAATDGADATLQSYLPAAVGQAVLLAPAAAGTPCTVRSVTAVAAATDVTPQQLTFAAAGAHNQARFGSGTDYEARSRAVLLGSLQWRRLRLDNGALLLEQPITGASATLLRQVVALRADYGTTAAAGQSTLAAWSPATDSEWATLDAAKVTRVRALRIGLVMRSSQREKPDRDGVCRASLAKPELFGRTIEPDVEDWACWRFRSTSVVVPLRNVVWGLSS